MRTSLVALAAAAAVLAGCGRESGDADATDSGPPAAGNARIAATTAARPPGFVPLYPGATIDTSVSGGAGAGGDDLHAVVGALLAGAEHQSVAGLAGEGRGEPLGRGLRSIEGDDVGGLVAGLEGQGADDGMQIIATRAGGSTSVQVIWTDAKKG